MNPKRLKTLLLFLSIIQILIAILSHKNFINKTELLFQIISFSTFENISLNEIDHLSSLVCFIIFTFLSILFVLHYITLIQIKFFEKLTVKILSASKELTIGFLMIFMILFISLTAPLISPDDPTFHKDVAITKLLPPFSSVNYIQLKEKNDALYKANSIRKNIRAKLKDENRIYFTNFNLKDTLIILGKVWSTEFYSISEVESINNKPIIKSKLFILGTDEFGRDLLSRLIYSIRLSLFIALFSVFVSFLLGSTIGYVAGVLGGFVDNLLMRVVDFFLSFPILFFVIFLIAFVGNSILLLIIVFGFSGWMYIARLARNESLSLMKKEFIQVLLLAGQSRLNIIIKHILPNTFSPILITLIFLMSNVIIAESALSFLGLGVQPPTPTLGGIIKGGYDYLSIGWWIALFSSSTLVVFILSFNLLAEGIKKINFD